jgi:hypothetical protein
MHERSTKRGAVGSLGKQRVLTLCASAIMQSLECGRNLAVSDDCSSH